MNSFKNIIQRIITVSLKKSKYSSIFQLLTVREHLVVFLAVTSEWKVSHTNNAKVANKGVLI